MPASKIAFVSAKKSLMSLSIPCPPAPWWSRCETNCANRSQCPGGSSECGPFAQYSAIILGQAGIGEQSNYALTVVSSIGLPDGSSYQFPTYDGYGGLTGITLPTGGQIT